MEESSFPDCGMSVGGDSVWVGLPQTQGQVQPAHSLCYMWLSSLVRIMRKRLVLGLIFAFSLSYCLISLYYGSQAMGRGDDSAEELNIVPRWQVDGMGNFPWRSAEDDHAESGPPLDTDPVSNDTLRHLQGGDNPGEASPASSVAKNPAPCRNSIQGLQLIADDRGYVCKRDEVLPTGCCDKSISTTSRYVCESCLSNHCCKIYEHCVSCCLDPGKKSILQAILAKLPEHQNLLFASVTDHFELCLAKCRTSSESVQHQNLYRNPQAKHCYGSQLPDIHHGP